MMVLFLHNFILRTILLGSLTFLSSCAEHKENYHRDNNLNSINPNGLLYDDEISDEHLLDTVTVQTTDELINHIRSNRLIKLTGDKYVLNYTLLIDSIKNLKIVGTGSSELMIKKRNSSVIKLLNSSNIHLDSLIIGHKVSSGYVGEQGALRISQSNNINISNCILYGAGTFGLTTFDVNNLRFINSEITECTLLIFDLEKSSKFEFINSKFYNNSLEVSVLGGFTNSTKEITFLNCGFINNKPSIVGNPAFNFDENWKDFEERIIFENCVFNNNKGYKWYGDKIELKSCIIDSTDFISFE